MTRLSPRSKLIGCDKRTEHGKRRWACVAVELRVLVVPWFNAIS